MRALCLALASLFVFSFAQSAQACERPDNVGAWVVDNVSAGERVRDWPSLYRFYEQYVAGMCYHGYVEEAYPALVAERFVRQWGTLPVYAKLAAANGGFKRFILDQLSSSDYMLEDARATYRLARDKCPKDMAATCKDIIDAVLTTAKDEVMKDPPKPAPGGPQGGPGGGGSAPKGDAPGGPPAAGEPGKNGPAKSIEDNAAPATPALTI